MIRACDLCQEMYEAARPSSRFCSSRCRTRAHREPPAVLLPALGVVSVRPVTAVRDAVHAELAAAGREGSYLGSLALGLAARIDSHNDGIALALLIRELRQTMDAALTAEHSAVADPVDELRARRDQVRHARTPSSAKDDR